MARVVRRAASALARRGPTRAVERRARKHKVVMESITREKKKLRTIFSFEAKAPSGYTFIPAGNPHLTTACKERCRKEGLEVHAVSTTPHLNAHNLSQHVHRIGFHFPSTVVAAVCSELGLYLTNTGKAVPFHTLGSQNNKEVDLDAPQEVINTDARDAIKDLFPNIPDDDLFQIIKTSFQKGQKKVGTAFELPLARRAQLAVVAHVRHVYTDYDRLLKQGSFHEARTAVELPTLSKVIAWRGDDENGRTILEDVFREVIVISDDDDSDIEEESTATGNRDLSVEIVRSNAKDHQIQTQPLRGDRQNLDPALDLSEEAPPGFRVVTTVPATRAVDRRGFSRYQAWNRALTRYRAEVQNTEQPRLGDSSKDKPSPRLPNRPPASQEIAEPPRTGDVALHPMEPPTRIAQAPPYEAPFPQRPPSGISHMNVTDRRSHLDPQPAYPQSAPQINSQAGYPASIQLTNQKPLDNRLRDNSPRWSTNAIPAQGKSHQSHLPPYDKANIPVFVNGARELQTSDSHFGSRPEPPAPPSHHRPGMSPRDQVLPSIETQWQPEKRRPDSGLEHMTKRMTLRSVTPVHSLGAVFDHGPGSAPNSPDDPNGKRRRTAYYSGSHHDLRSEARNGRPIPVSEDVSPRISYRRDNIGPELFGPELRSQEGLHLRRDYPTPQEQPSRSVHLRDRHPGSFIVQPTTLDPRPAADRMRFDPTGHMPLHNPPPSSGASGMIPTGGGTFRPILDSPRLEAWPSYPTDRSPRFDRVRFLNAEEPRPATWDPRTDSNRHTFYEPPPGKVYADGFVRQVDIREARPVDFPNNRPRPQPGIIQPSRSRAADHFASDIPLPRSSSEQRQVPSPRVAQQSHNQSSLRPDNTRARGRGTGSRDRRHGSAFSTTRRGNNSRYFQMAEQNRPVYVQRVESQSPQNPVPDRRHVVIVD